ncbi:MULTISPECIES: M20 family metallopeptidase [Dictyoglomus]|uniref:M20 family metallopeptidase n=1 Tax=Dictyoglomus TaxID=13 RepID=UPI000CCEB384|nr:M20 family metallopeptidase [Dictyoglomus turgidum]PNV78777.1 MAG: amidohydrolase [Dictyoglomus turgidum]
MNIKEDIQKIMPEVINIRRDIHMYPELGFQEFRTSQLIASYLENLELEVRKNIAQTGVLGILRGKEEGKTILLRADIDALPLEELNDVPYKSKNKGIMHACGHDGHIAILLGTAKILAKYKDQIKGIVKFAFQPAEELPPGGAEPMIKEGILENPYVDKVYALHLANHLKVGKIAVRKGFFCAQADAFTIKVKGRGGHGSTPDKCIDPIIISTHIVQALQEIPSREIDPHTPFVLSICKIQSGNTFNVIPEDAEIEGTVRTFDKNLAETISKRIETISKNIAEAFRGKAEIEYQFGYPPGKNDEKEAEFVKKIAEEVVGKENVIEDKPSMGGEDFSYFLEERPGAMFWLGSGNEERGLNHPHHSPYFDFDESAMAIGIEMFVRIVLENLL